MNKKSIDTSLPDCTANTPFMKEQLWKLAQEFSSIQDELLKYTYLVELGSLLPGLNENEKREDNLFRGCQSRVWLQLSCEGKTLSLRSDSNTAIIRGILYILETAYNGADIAEAVHLRPNIPRLIGLEEAFTSERALGIRNIQQHITEYCLVHMNSSNFP